MKSTGKRRVHAVDRPSQNSPSLVVPSPSDTYTISSRSKCIANPTFSPSSARYRPASAQPTACSTCVPVGLDCDTMCSGRCPQWLGIWRPPLAGSPAAPTASSSIS
jgi:hypothetical protein